eukprot:5865925-Prymnesium_polylepis.1
MSATATVATNYCYYLPGTVIVYVIRSVCPCTASHLLAPTLSRTCVKRAVHAVHAPTWPEGRMNLVS